MLAVRRTDSALSAPDVQLLFLDILLVRPTKPAPRDGYAIAFSALRPHSRGSVMLSSSDPEAAPLIDPSLLSDERDMMTMVGRN